MGSARKILQGGSRQQPTAAGNGSGTSSATSRREGTKRITVDLPRDEHKFLRDAAYDTDGMKVVRALLMELRDDEDLRGRVAARLAGL